MSFEREDVWIHGHSNQSADIYHVLYPEGRLYGTDITIFFLKMYLSREETSPYKISTLHSVRNISLSIVEWKNGILKEIVCRWNKSFPFS